MIEALLENLRFFENSPWPELYQRIIRCCLTSISRQLNQLEDSSLSEKEKESCRTWLLRQLDDIKKRSDTV